MSRDYFSMYSDSIADHLPTLEAAGAFGMFLWMNANSFFREQAERFEGVGPWVAKGLVVSRFTHDEYIRHIEKLGGKLSPSTSKRYLKVLVDSGWIHILRRGGDGGLSYTIAAIGFWSDNGSRIKMLAPNWITKKGLDPAVRKELTALRATLSSRREAQRAAAYEAENPSVKNDTPVEPSVKNDTRGSVKNDTRDVGNSSSSTAEIGTPYKSNLDVEINTSYLSPEAAPRSTVGSKRVAGKKASFEAVQARLGRALATPTEEPLVETAANSEKPPKRQRQKRAAKSTDAAVEALELSDHTRVKNAVATAIYGDTKLVTPKTWQRINGISAELRSVMSAEDVERTCEAVLKDPFWKGKLSLGNITEQVTKAYGNGKSRSAPDAQRAKAAELYGDDPEVLGVF